MNDPYTSAERRWLEEPDRLCEECLENERTAPDGLCDGCMADLLEAEQDARALAEGIGWVTLTGAAEGGATGNGPHSAATRAAIHPTATP